MSSPHRLASIKRGTAQSGTQPGGVQSRPAGPTGLTLAVDLARRGVSFRIVERDGLGLGNDDATHLAGSRGKGLQPRTLKIFDDLGVIDEILRTGERYPLIRVYAGRLPVWKAYMHKQQEATAAIPYPMIIMQPQWRTEQILRARLAELGGAGRKGRDRR